MSRAGRPAGFILIACLAAPCVAAEPSLALTNVLYEEYAHSPADAYTRALYYERRGVDSATARQLALARAGFALDMGMQEDAKEILASIDEQSLAPPERARLHFFLARTAYRDKDWARFEQELGRIAPDAAPLETPMGRFLMAEGARLGGHFDKSDRLLKAIPRDQPLLSYARFNLGASAVAAGQPGIARAQFLKLVKAPALSMEQLLIAERARIALSNLDIEAKQYDDAANLLSRVTVTGEYGPQAVAQLAELSMHQGDFKRAAQLWSYLLAKWPWHPAAREAHAALPYSLEKAQGADAAYAAYATANVQLAARQKTLTALSGRIEQIDPVMLAHALRHPGDADSRATIALLQSGLDSADWANWLSDAQSHSIADRIERLHDDIRQLHQKRRDLDILLGVDAEQQRRIHDAASKLAGENDQARLDAIKKRLDAVKAKLADFAATPPFDARLAEFATDAEKQQLNQIDALAARAARTGADAHTKARIATLRGLVLYRIYDDLPVRIRARQRANEALQASLDAAQQRIDRIARAARTVGSAGSVSSRIQLLSARTDTLLARTQGALDDTGVQLIARLRAGVSSESADIERQIVYVHLAMARIGDARMLAAEAHK